MVKVIPFNGLLLFFENLELRKNSNFKWVDVNGRCNYLFKHFGVIEEALNT